MKPGQGGSPSSRSLGCILSLNLGCDFWPDLGPVFQKLREFCSKGRSDPNNLRNDLPHGLPLKSHKIGVSSPWSVLDSRRAGGLQPHPRDEERHLTWTTQVQSRGISRPPLGTSGPGKVSRAPRLGWHRSRSVQPRKEGTCIPSSPCSRGHASGLEMKRDKIGKPKNRPL